MSQPLFIVAECTKSWQGASPGLLSQMFESIIEVNHKRGYRLQDWRLSQVSYPDEQGIPVITETIVAVFKRALGKHGSIGGYEVGR